MYAMYMTPSTHQRSLNQHVSMWFHCDLLKVKPLILAASGRQKPGKNKREQAGGGE